MQETLHDHSTTISIGGNPVCNLRFADDIDLMGGSNAELQELTDKLATKAGAYGMEISAAKSKTMVNSNSNTTANITLKGEELENVSSFKYLGATLTQDGASTTEIRTRIALATAAMAKLSRIWKSSISFFTKFHLYKSLVVSVLLYGCETWTLLADTERRIEAFELKCWRRLLRLTYLDRKTNEYVRSTVELFIGPQEPLLATVKRRKLSFFGHTMRHDNLCKTIMQGTIEGGRRRGRQRKAWADNIRSWTGLSTPELLAAASDRELWRQVLHSSAFRSPQRCSRRGKDK